jgi:hypothetical protein
MAKQVFLAPVPPTSSETCSHPQHATAYPANYIVNSLDGSEAETTHLCLHHLIKMADKDEVVRKSLSQIGEVTEFGGGAFEFRPAKGK